MEYARVSSRSGLADEAARNIQHGLDALRRRHGEKRLGHTGTEAGNDGPWAGKLAVGIHEELLVLIKRDETCSLSV